MAKELPYFRLTINSVLNRSDMKCKNFFCDNYFKDGRSNCDLILTTYESKAFTCDLRIVYDRFWRWLSKQDYELSIPVKVKLEGIKSELKE